MEFPPGRLPTDQQWPYDQPTDPRDVPTTQLDGAVVPFSGILRDFDGLLLHPGPEVDAGDLAVEKDGRLEFYSQVHQDHGTRRRFAVYERRAGAWWAVR